MTEGVTSFLDITKRSADILFILVNLRLNNADEDSALDRAINQFGADLERRGRVVRAHPHKFHEVQKEVRDKSWPAETAAQIEQRTDPFMIVLDQDFRTFNPRSHVWAIKWFPNSPSLVSDLQHAFTLLARKLRSGENVIEHLNEAHAEEPATESSEGDEGAGEALLVAEAQTTETALPTPVQTHTSPTIEQEASGTETRSDGDDYDRLIDRNEVARLTSMSYSWVGVQRKKRRDGESHQFDVEPIYVGKSVRYRLGDVMDWIRARQ